jgi:ABC-2 type transport system permease protein
VSFWGNFLRTLHDIATDQSAVVMLMFSVVIYSFFYPSAYMHQVTLHVPLAVADLDNSVLSRKLTQAAAATQGVEVVSHPGSMDEAKRELLAGSVDSILWIGPGFERDVLRGKAGDIAIVSNGAYLIRTRATLAAMGDAIVKAAGDAIRLTPTEGIPAAAPVRLVVRPLYNTREGYGSAIVPAVFMLIVQQTLTLGIGLVMATWRGRGLTRFKPVAFLGTAFAFFTIGICGVFYFCGMGFWLQDYPRGGNLAGLFVVGPLYVTAVVAMGLFLGSFYRRRDQSGQFLLGTSLPFYFLAGISWPHTVVPAPLVWLSNLIPSTSAMQAVVKMMQMGATLDEIRPEILDLALLVFVFGAGASWRLLTKGRDFRF